MFFENRQSQLSSALPTKKKVWEHEWGKSFFLGKKGFQILFFAELTNLKFLASSSPGAGSYQGNSSWPRQDPGGRPTCQGSPYWAYRRFLVSRRSRLGRSPAVSDLCWLWPTLARVARASFSAQLARSIYRTYRHFKKGP